MSETEGRTTEEIHCGTHQDEDLPKDQKISKEELKRIMGGCVKTLDKSSPKLFEEIRVTQAMVGNNFEKVQVT